MPCHYRGDTPHECNFKCNFKCNFNQTTSTRSPANLGKTRL
jgi:hypothetical protein